MINSKIITKKNDFIEKIQTTGKSLEKIIEFEKTIGKQDKLNKITKQLPLDTNSVKQKSEWINL